MSPKYIFSLFLALLLQMNLYAQDSFFSYQKIKVDEIPSIEKKFNAKIFYSKMDYITQEKEELINYGKPKVYRREKNKLLDIIEVKYFYLKNDSIVNNVSYSWASPEKAKLKDFSKMFDKTVKKISADLNLPIGEQGKLQIIMDETVNGIPVQRTERRVTWEYHGAKILILMIWTETKGAYLATSIKWE